MKFPEIELIAKHAYGIPSDKLEKGTADNLRVVYEAIKNLLENETTSELVSEVTLCLESLIDAPEIKNQLVDENENTIFVESVDVIEDSCGTGRLEIFGRSVLLNMCEMDDTIHVNLDLSINGKSVSGVPFVVKVLTEEKDPYIKLSKSILK